MEGYKKYYSLVSGGSSGFVEICLMHPMDVIKTRFQIQRGPEDPQRYSSLRDCFRKMYTQEGFLSFYRGIGPPICAEIPKRGLKFFSFEEYKKLFSFGDLFSRPVILTLAGLFAGLTEGVLINPFEVVKVNLQADRREIHKQKSMTQTAREIVRADGIGKKGLFKGLTSTLGRHGVFNMIYFSFNYNIKEISPTLENSVLNGVKNFAIGFASGTIACCFNIPFDVAKSRIQAPQPVPGEIKYRTCFQTLITVYKEEGFLALYKGLVPKIIRLGPGGAILFYVNDYVLDWMKANL